MQTGAIAVTPQSGECVCSLAVRGDRLHVGYGVTTAPRASCRSRVIEVALEAASE